MCIKASAKTIALIDHTKFDTSSISSYASIDDLNLVITDSGLSEIQKKSMKKPALICSSPTNYQFSMFNNFFIAAA